MKEYIDINLITDICIKKRSKRKEIIKRLSDNLGITDLRKYFKKEEYSFDIYIEENKIFFDKSKFISILCDKFSVENEKDTDDVINQVIKSDISEIPSLLPSFLENKVALEVKDLNEIKKALNSMVISKQILSSFNTEGKKVEYSEKVPDKFKQSMNKELEKVETRYNSVLKSMKDNNLYIENLIKQLDAMYSNRIKSNLVNAYMGIKKELKNGELQELTDQFVIENIHYEKLLYVSLVSAYKNKNTEYLEENIKKLTKGRISELTEMITDKYYGKNKEFLKNMKEFELAYGRSSIKKDELLIDGVDIHTFGYNFLSLENKKEIKAEIEKVKEIVAKKYQSTQDDRYLVLYDKLQVIEELDIKELYIGKNSFQGYIGYREENSNIMLEKYFEDSNKQRPAIDEACYVVSKEDFETLAMHDKQTVIEMIKEGTIHAKRFYHNRLSSKNKKQNGKKLFKEKVLNAMRNSL